MRVRVSRRDRNEVKEGGNMSSACTVFIHTPPSLPPSLPLSFSSQAYAAEELYRREWRFHKEMKLWVKQEGGQSWYFDINHWYVLPPASPLPLPTSLHTRGCARLCPSSAFLVLFVPALLFLSFLSACPCLVCRSRSACSPPPPTPPAVAWSDIHPLIPAPLPSLSPSSFSSLLDREKRVFPQTTPANMSAIATGASEGGREKWREGGRGDRLKEICRG